MALIALVLAATGMAQTPETPAAAQPEERRICRRQVSTATRMGYRRVCKTASEWAATARNPDTDMSAQDGMDPRARIPTTTDCGGMCGSSAPR